MNHHDTGPEGSEASQLQVLEARSLDDIKLALGKFSEGGLGKSLNLEAGRS